MQSVVLPQQLAMPTDDAGFIPPIPRVAIQAFCESQDVAASIQRAESDRRLDRANLKVQMGGATAAVEAYRSAPTPNIVILESALGDGQHLIRSLDQLSEYCDAGTKVIVIGHVNDVLLYRELIRRGVSDYLIAPLTTVQLIRSISELYNAPGTEPLGKTIAIIGTKGGVGASTVAHNLSWSIARGLSISTVLVDLDLGFGTAGLNFNQDPPQGISEAVFAPERLDSNMIERLLSKCAENLTLLAAPATLERFYDFPEAAFDPIIDVLRATTPYIVLDLPHQWTAWSRRILASADDILIVCAPDLANLRNAKTMMDVLRQARPNDKPPKLVLNMVGVTKRPEINPADFSKAIDCMPTAIIPFDAQIFGTAANNGQMIAEIQANGKIAQTFAELARGVTGRVEPQRVSGSFISPLISKLRRKG
jgi:pilus assembly protein CpaE